MAHLTASMMSQLGPVDFEFAMIVHVHQFMDKSVFHVLPAEKVASTKHDSASVG
jgi:hypothetical protein